MHACIHTCIQIRHRYIFIYLSVCLPVDLPLPTELPTYLSTHRLTNLPTCRLTYLPTTLPRQPSSTSTRPPFIHLCLPAFLFCTHMHKKDTCTYICRDKYTFESFAYVGLHGRVCIYLCIHKKSVYLCLRTGVIIHVHTQTHIYRDT